MGVASAGPTGWEAALCCAGLGPWQPAVPGADPCQSRTMSSPLCLRGVAAHPALPAHTFTLGFDLVPGKRRTTSIVHGARDTASPESWGREPEGRHSFPGAWTGSSGAVPKPRRSRSLCFKRTALLCNWPIQHIPVPREVQLPHGAVHSGPWARGWVCPREVCPLWELMVPLLPPASVLVAPGLGQLDYWSPRNWRRPLPSFLPCSGAPPVCSPTQCREEGPPGAQAGGLCAGRGACLSRWA